MRLALYQARCMSDALALLFRFPMVRQYARKPYRLYLPDNFIPRLGTMRTGMQHAMHEWGRKTFEGQESPERSEIS